MRSKRAFGHVLCFERSQELEVARGELKMPTRARNWVGTWMAWCLLAVLATTSLAQEKQADRYFDSNGVKIHYTDVGEGEPVLLIHGFAVNIPIQWGGPGVIGSLSKEYRVIAFDNRGHGKSGKPHEPADYGANMAEDAVRLLDHLKIDKAHVVGYSMGAWITLKLITAHPDRVRSAVLGGAGWLREGDENWKLGEELAHSLESGKGFRPLIVELNATNEPPPSEERIRAVSLVMTATNDVKALVGVVRGMNGLIVSESSLANNQVPTLAIVGDQDPLKAKNVDPMIGKMKNLELVVVENADHMTTFLKPEFFRSLRAFLAANSSKELSGSTEAKEKSDR
ncbi:MAG: alpha/beta hydrolase [Planctomycetota bacterium]